MFKIHYDFKTTKDKTRQDKTRQDLIIPFLRVKCAMLGVCHAPAMAPIFMPYRRLCLYEIHGKQAPHAPSGREVEYYDRRDY